MQSGAGRQWSRVLVDWLLETVNVPGPAPGDRVLLGQPPYPRCACRVPQGVPFGPDGYQSLHRLSEIVKGSGLEPELLELVKMRASQINGCAYCIDMPRRMLDERARTAHSR